MDAGGGVTTLPTGAQVKKGRRGLAKKKITAAVGVDTASTSHITSIYSSCVSRGYKGLMEETEIASNVSKNENNCGLTDSDKDVKTTETIPDKSHSVVEEDVQVISVEENEKLRYEADDSILLDDDDEIVDAPKGAESLRSPTPPPTTAGMVGPKKRRMNRQLTSALKTLNKAKGSLNMTPSTPFTKSRRGGKKTGQVGQTNNEFTYLEYSPEKKEMHVKVRYLSNVYRMLFQMTDPLHRLLHDLSMQIGQEEKHLGLFLNDQALPLSKTPKDIGLTVADIIECHCVKDSTSGSANESLYLLIQCSNSKRKTQVNVTKRDTFKCILDVYAQQVGIDAAPYAFSFDGDDVDPEEIPITYDMDDGDVLDLVPATTATVRAQRSWQTEVITIL